jgi:ribosomal RNA-processing protein 8
MLRKKKSDDAAKALQSRIQQRRTDKQRLEGAKFRLLNEKLYTTTSDAADRMFKSNPGLFDVMHQGFVSQADTWPVVPVDEVITWLRGRYPPPAVIADMGCGDAKIQSSVANRVFSFDFKARNPAVVECDMRRTPLEMKSVDVVVFVMSLMGTNLSDFIDEAKRIVRDGGGMLIVEITSRIDRLELFVKGIEERGFKLTAKRDLTSFFTWLEFTTGPLKTNPAQLSLKPCLYKRR